MKLALIGTGIGALIVAIGAVAMAYITWKDEIHAFLRYGWNMFLDAISGGYPIIRSIARALGKEMPDSIDAYKVAAVEAEAATVAVTAAVEDAAPKYESLTGFISEPLRLPRNCLSRWPTLRAPRRRPCVASGP